MDADELAERMAEPWFDPAGFLSPPRGPPASASTGRNDTGDARRGVRRRLDPASQGLGLGKALVDAGLRHLRDGRARTRCSTSSPRTCQRSGSTREVGGELDVRSAPGGGTSVTLRVRT